MFRILATIVFLFLLCPVAGLHSASGQLPTSRPVPPKPPADQATAGWIIGCLHRSADLLAKHSDDPEFRQLYRNVWSAAISFGSQTHDAQARQSLIDEWHTAWKQPANISLLSGALADCAINQSCDRSWITRELLEGWRNAHDESTLNSMAYWIAKCGNDDDARFLESKKKDAKDVNESGIIDLGLLYYAIWHGKHIGEPAALGEPGPGD